jgi:hypothetical protein
MVKVVKKEFKKLYDIACNDWKTKLVAKLADQMFNDSNTLEFEEGFVGDMKKACSADQLKVFKKVFADYIKEESFEDVTDYKEVCKRLAVPVLTEKDFSFLPQDQRGKALAFHKIKNLEKFFNKNWVPNFSDSSEYKYYPYFEKRSGRWVFIGSYGYLYGFSGGVGLYKSKEISDHIGNNFKDIYISLLD